VPRTLRDGVEVDTVANPLRMSLTPIRYDLPPPSLGEHTGEVLGRSREKDVHRGTIRGEPGNAKEKP
jgi:crotonobetainyl-CoA:carnitine CoA-transferase CaiB-like acyl-CoA transferase